METFSALLALCEGNSPVNGEFPSQMPVTRRFDVFFDLHLNKRLSKQSRRRWFKTLSRPLWRHGTVFAIPWWHHGTETLSALLDLCAWNPLITRGPPNKRPVMRTFGFSLVSTSCYHDVCLTSLSYVMITSCFGYSIYDHMQFHIGIHSSHSLWTLCNLFFLILYWSKSYNSTS